MHVSSCIWSTPVRILKFTQAHIPISQKIAKKLHLVFNFAHIIGNMVGASLRVQTFCNACHALEGVEGEILAREDNPFAPGKERLDSTARDGFQGPS